MKMCGCPKYLSYPVIFMVLNLSPVLETWSLPVANLPADNLPAATFQQHNLPTEGYKLEATNPNPWTTILFNKYSSINNRTYNYEFMSDNDESLEDYTSERQQTISDLYSPITSENNFLPDSLNLPLLSRLKHRNKALDRMIDPESNFYQHLLKSKTQFCDSYAQVNLKGDVYERWDGIESSIFQLGTRIIMCKVSKTSAFTDYPGLERQLSSGLNVVDIIESDLPNVEFQKLLQNFAIDTAQINKINITGSEINGATFNNKTFTNLQVLDLRGNRLIGFKGLTLPSLQELYLSDNEWMCIEPGSGIGKWSLSTLDHGKRLRWLVENPKYLHSVWKDQNDTHCTITRLQNRRPHWYDEGQVRRNARNQILLKHFLLKAHDALQNCPMGCDCELAKPLSETHMGTYKKLGISVLCSYLNLTSLPRRLPEDTIYFDASNNNISDFRELRGEGSAYKQITKINLSRNNIRSLQIFRDSWLLKSNPTEIDLRWNNIRKFDISVLEQLLSQHSTKMKSIEEGLNFLFSGNPWQCSCSSIKQIQEFLYKYQFLIKDADEMKCIDPDLSILDLNFKLLCHPPDNSQYLMTCLVIVELILLISLTVKLIYDTVNYHRTGHLPWVARHLCGGENHQLLHDSIDSTTKHTSTHHSLLKAPSRFIKTYCCCCKQRAESTLSEQAHLQPNGGKNGGAVMRHDQLQLSRRWQRTYSTMSRVNRFSTALDSAYGGSRRLDRSMSCYGGHSGELSGVDKSPSLISASMRQYQTVTDYSQLQKKSSKMSTKSPQLNLSYASLSPDFGPLRSNKEEAKFLSDVRLNNLRLKHEQKHEKEAISKISK